MNFPPPPFIFASYMHFSAPVIILTTFLKKKLKQYIVTYLATSQTIWNFSLHLWGGKTGENPSNKLEKRIHLLNSPSGSTHSTSRQEEQKTQAKFNKSIIHCELFTSFYSKHCQDVFVYFYLEFKKIHGNIAVCLSFHVQSANLCFFTECLYLTKEKQQSAEE